MLPSLEAGKGASLVSSLKQHISDCESALGDGHERVHRWLDEFTVVERGGQFYFDMNHRSHRHTKEGIKKDLEMWGSDAARAAHIHIIADEHEVPTRERILGRYPAEDLYRIKDGGTRK